MRIYASNNILSTPDVLAEYVGKDVWLRCRLTYSDKSGYIRIIRITYDSVEVNWLGGTVAEYIHDLDPDVARRMCGQLTNIPINKIELPDPVEAIPSEELLPNMVHTDLAKYAGKDVWVLVNLNVYSFAGLYYIKILSIDSGVALFRKLDPQYVDDHLDMDESTAITYQHMISSNSTIHYVTRAHVDAIDIITPIQILSTDEVIEELEQCDVLADDDESFYDDDI